uniref:Surfactant protein B n=1 Tax=Accipiter nisus TaxID=211598 RepID=A0A8B9MJU2_9AVES
MGTWPRGTRGCGDTSRATGGGGGPRGAAPGGAGGGGGGLKVAAPRCPRGRGARVPVVLAPTQRPPPAGAIRGRRGLALPAPPWHRHPCWHSSSPCSVPPQVGNPATPAWVPPQNWVPLLPKLERHHGELGATPDLGVPHLQLGDMCADCQQIITLLTRMANESATKGFLRRECAALPVPSMVPPCQNLVHEYFSLLLLDLEGHLKPSAICARLELCPGEPGGAPAMPRLGALSTRLQVQVLGAAGGGCPGAPVATSKALPIPLPLCWLCRTFLARAEATVPKEAVAEAATKLCRVLPVVVVGACQCLVQRYGVLLVEEVLGRLAPRLLCRLLLTCGPEDGYAPSSPPRQTLGAAAAPPAACAGTEVSGVTRCKVPKRHHTPRKCARVPKGVTAPR